MRFKASWVTLLLFVVLVAVMGYRAWTGLHPSAPHTVAAPR